MKITGLQRKLFEVESVHNSREDRASAHPYWPKDYKKWLFKLTFSSAPS